jgi:thiosulfate/3-mercaptopyruvate sulfurtransferase
MTELADRPNKDLLIHPAALLPRLEGPGPPLLLDLRPAEQFASGHLSGAVHLDLWGFSLIDTDPAPLRAFLWMVEHVLALRGVTAERPVVLYGEHSDLRAARVFWFLEFFGHPDVRVLDGGTRAWVADGLPLSTESVSPTPSTWTGQRRTETLATWRDVSERLGAGDVAVLDTRTDEEYFGTHVRAARGGAIPGAVHLEWTCNLTPRGSFKPPADLRHMYESSGITGDREVVTYCQGGYRAAHSYLALRLAGYPRLRTYLGSWKEWGDRTDLPIETPRSSTR